MKKVGLALGGGSAKGCAHAGVINALEEAGIPIHMVAGTSIGSLIGGVYAAGALPELVSIGKDISWHMVLKHLDLAYPRQGIMSGKRVERFLDELMPISNIENLPIPYCAIAADISTAEEVQINSGKLVDAIRASISLPAIFTPVKQGDRFLVDGGLVNPVPVNVVRAMGADIVIAVDLNHGKNRVIDDQQATLSEDASFFEQLKHDAKASKDKAIQRFREWTKSEGPAMYDVLGWSVNIMQEQITEKNLRTDPADILIRPALGHIRGVDFHKAEEMIEIGYEATQPEIEKIKALI